MVKVRAPIPIQSDGTPATAEWLAAVQAQVSRAEVSRVGEACAQVQMADPGRSDVEHPNSLVMGLQMAQMLVDLDMDADTVVVGILYRAVSEGKYSLDSVRRNFGDGIASLIECVERMGATSLLKLTRSQTVLGAQRDQLDNVRNMLVALVDDVRVAVVKLVERVCTLRGVKNENHDLKQRLAREASEVWAPLANRLGIWDVKWELEDLALRYLEPYAYKNIARLLEERRVEREVFVDNVIVTLGDQLSDAGIDAEVHGRAKHIYGIFRKMRSKGVGFDQIYDVRALRILVPEVKDCYAALGIVHSLWRHIPHEFDDYVANPKENGYRSIHTAVFGPDGRVLEVQIRTFSMHRDAELGVCAHWAYKGDDASKPSLESSHEAKLNWLRQVLEWHDELGDFDSLREDLRRNFTEDRIYVFTPEGHVLDLVAGSTPVDFAYRVHTEIGHRCRGARVDGRIVPMAMALKSGQMVEILTSGTSQPSRDWLNPNLGYVKSPRALAKIQAWFRAQDHERKLGEGEKLLQDAFRRLALVIDDRDLLATRLGHSDYENLCVAIGSGAIEISRVVRAAADLRTPSQAATSVEPPRGRDDDANVRGVGNFPVSFAHCCNPIPGDPIGGYITQTRGVTVHRKDCPQFLRLYRENHARVLEVSWGFAVPNLGIFELEISAYDRPGLLRDVAVVLADDDINMVWASINTDRSTLIATIELRVEVENIERLSRAIDRIGQ
ncbi:MAG: bifunctional (p)ppGpp synthetase/guanosine-3',5'-bis(diphosphate) 3'-pyrophosphohydrolase, partial [Pseudomonadales bacterium]